MAFHIPNSWRRLFVFALMISLCGGPAAAYVVVLTDGTQLVIREKYRTEGDKVFLLLLNGTETFIDAEEIDFEKTEEFNSINIGQARMVEQRLDTVFVEDDVPEEETLSSLAQKTRLSLPAIKQRETTETEETRAIPHTDAGFADLWSLERAIHSDEELVQDLESYLQGQGSEDYESFEGTADQRVLIQMIASSEAAVFKNLRDAAAALIQTQTRFPDKLEVLELVMVTSQGTRSGQFILNRELADKLTSGSIDPQTFFYRHVQF